MPRIPPTDPEVIAENTRLRCLAATLQADNQRLLDLLSGEILDLKLAISKAPVRGCCRLTFPFARHPRARGGGPR